MGAMLVPDILTRSAALARLAEVTPRVGRFYAAHRNTDAGPLAEATTTALSPFLRRRLLLEQEVVQAALDAHGPEAAGKFVDEVFWRTYFKGYLETHPAIWPRTLQVVAEQRGRVATNSGLRRAYDAAISGQTGIDGFDDWARELVERGWLHNHARMWFASVWIFTLRLPWELGADFFLRHLLDGDPASNTLSWRWVAGLHTRGKAYAARAENIGRYTGGRFEPTGLNEDPVPLEEADPPRAAPLPPADPAPTGPCALLLHGDDLHPESLPLERATVVRVAGLLAHCAGRIGPGPAGRHDGAGGRAGAGPPLVQLRDGAVGAGLAGRSAGGHRLGAGGSVGPGAAARLPSGAAALGRADLATRHARLLPGEDRDSRHPARTIPGLRGAWRGS